MPFNDPTFGIDLADGEYWVKVLKVEDAPANEYGPGVKWTFSVATLGGQVIRDENGYVAELFQYSSAKLSPTSKAGGWASALLGRSLTRSDTGVGITQAVIGRKAVATIHRNSKNERCTIAELRPMGASSANGNTNPADALMDAQKELEEIPF
jgi:hypothetical protein